MIVGSGLLDGLAISLLYCIDTGCDTSRRIPEGLGLSWV